MLTGILDLLDVELQFFRLMDLMFQKSGKSDLAASRSEARRNVEQGGVSVDGTQIKDIKAVFAKDQFAGDGVVVKRGKKNFKKVILK